MKTKRYNKPYEAGPLCPSTTSHIQPIVAMTPAVVDTSSVQATGQCRGSNIFNCFSILDNCFK